MNEATTPTVAGPLNRRSLAAMMLCNFVGLQGPIILPLWLGVSIDTFHINVAIGGWLATSELGALAVAALFVAPLMNRADRRLICWAGLFLAVLGNGLSIGAAVGESLPTLFLARTLTGAGEGLIVAAVSAAAAGTANPQRTYSWINGAFVVLGAVVFFIAPPITGAFGAAGVFGIMTAMGVLGILIAFYLPPKYEKVADSYEKKASPFTRTALIALLGYGIAHSCFVRVWTFVERVGVISINLSLGEIAPILAVGAVFGITGPIAAHAYGARWGRFLPILTALLLYFGVIVIVSFSQSYALYVTAVIGANIIVVFFITCMMGMFAGLDPEGRIAAAAPACMSFGNAAGPVITGTAISAFANFDGLMLSGSLLLGLAAILLLPVIRRLDRGAV